jgi:hypothetical protein
VRGAAGQTRSKQLSVLSIVLLLEPSQIYCRGRLVNYNYFPRLCSTTLLSEFSRKNLHVQAFSLLHNKYLLVRPVTLFVFFREHKVEVVEHPRDNKSPSQPWLD